MNRITLTLIFLLLSQCAHPGPLDDATSLVFEWLQPPAPQSDWPEFNAALSDVITTASASRAANESLEFTKDQLDYQRKQHAAGTLGESELWQYAKRLVEARQTSEQKRVEYVQALHALAKRWGGERWWELRDMLVAYTGWHPDGCDTSAVTCD